MGNYDVFISYSRENSDIADSLCRELTSNRISYFRDTNDIEIGEDFPEKIVNAIKGSALVVFISTKQANEASTYVPREVAYALSKNKRVFPFRVDRSEYNSKFALDINERRNVYQAFETPPSLDVHIKEFVQQVVKHLDVNYCSKIEFKQITEFDDPDIEKLCMIYEKLFPEDENVAEEFLIQNLKDFEEGKHCAYLFVLKVMSSVVGFADVTYFNEQKRLFVSYVAVDARDVRAQRTTYTYSIISGFRNFFTANNIPLDDIVFEVENERTYRFFGRTTRNQMKLNLYRFDFEYLQPKMLSDNEAGVTVEVKSNLLILPLNNNNYPQSMPKEDVISIIQFIHDNIYWDITDTSIEKHKVYLDSLIKHYNETMPDDIVIECL